MSISRHSLTFSHWPSGVHQPSYLTLTCDFDKFKDLRKGTSTNGREFDKPHGDNLLSADYVQKIKRALERAELPFRVVGAVLFGSVVKGKETSESDVDLLIMAEDVHPRVHRRGDEIALIKRNLPGIPLDILLHIETEVVSNFRNHNPLFLDIAEEGEILLDATGILRGLMHETREYILKKGIKKLDDGWMFPVRPGIVTPLSKVSNRDFSIAMLEDGRRDFTIGKKLVREDIYDKAVYHFQQGAEKGVKAILIAIGVFKKTHFVGEILRGFVQEKKFSEQCENEMLEAAQISESLEPDVSLSRYPGIIEDSLWLPSEEYGEEDATRAMKKSERVLCIAEGFTNDWFSPNRQKTRESD